MAMCTVQSSAHCETFYSWVSLKVVPEMGYNAVLVHYWVLLAYRSELYVKQALVFSSLVS